METDLDTEHTLAAVRGRGLGSWMSSVQGLSKEKTESVMDTDHSMVIAREKEDGGVRRGEGE